MILYLDSSALVKRFVDESGSVAVVSALAEASAVLTSLIAYPEIRAALARAVRMGRLDGRVLDALVVELDRVWAALDVVEVTDALAHRAGELAQAHGLRGYDSVHLAAALMATESLGSGIDLRFGAFDAALCTAARACGLEVVPWG